MESIRPLPLSRCTSMAPAMMVSVNPDAFSNNKCTRQIEQELTEETEKEIPHLFLLNLGSHVAGLPRNSLFSPFAPVGNGSHRLALVFFGLNRREQGQSRFRRFLSPFSPFAPVEFFCSTRRRRAFSRSLGGSPAGGWPAAVGTARG